MFGAGRGIHAGRRSRAGQSGSHHHVGRAGVGAVRGRDVGR